MLTNENKFNKHTIVFVWLGGPLNPDLIQKMYALKMKGHDVALVWDSKKITQGTINVNNVEMDREKYCKEQISELSKNGIITLDADKEELFSSLEINGDLKSDEINSLKKIYNYHTNNPQRRNWAAAADIMRLIGMRYIQNVPVEKWKQNYNVQKGDVITYSDHDVSLGEKMLQQNMQLNGVTVNIQKIEGRVFLVFSNENGPAFNNAVISIHKDENHFLVDCLKKQAQRANQFLYEDNDINKNFYNESVRKLFSLSGRASNVMQRTTATFRVTGSGIIESVYDVNTHNLQKHIGMLRDQYLDKDNYDFFNANAQTWLKNKVIKGDYNDQDMAFLLSETLDSLFNNLNISLPANLDIKSFSQATKYLLGIDSVYFNEKIANKCLLLFENENEFQNYIRYFSDQQNHLVHKFANSMQNINEKYQLFNLLNSYYTMMVKMNEVYINNLKEYKNDNLDSGLLNNFMSQVDKMKKSSSNNDVIVALLQNIILMNGFNNFSERDKESIILKFVTRSELTHKLVDVMNPPSNEQAKKIGFFVYLHNFLENRQDKVSQMICENLVDNIMYMLDIGVLGENPVEAYEFLFTIVKKSFPEIKISPHRMSNDMKKEFLNAHLPKIATRPQLSPQITQYEFFHPAKPAALNLAKLQDKIYEIMKLTSEQITLATENNFINDLSSRISYNDKVAINSLTYVINDAINKVNIKINDPNKAIPKFSGSLKREESLEIINGLRSFIEAKNFKIKP